MDEHRPNKKALLVIATIGGVVGVIGIFFVIIRGGSGEDPKTSHVTGAALDDDNGPVEKVSFILRTDPAISNVTDRKLQELLRRRIWLGNRGTKGSWLNNAIYFVGNALDDNTIKHIVEGITSSLDSLEHRVSRHLLLPRASGSFAFVEVFNCLEKARCPDLSEDDMKQLEIAANKCIRDIVSPVNTYYLFLYREMTYKKVYPKMYLGEAEINVRKRFYRLFKMGKLLSDLAYAAVDAKELMKTINLSANEPDFLIIFYNAMNELRTSCRFDVVLPGLGIEKETLETEKHRDKLSIFYKGLMSDYKKVLCAINDDYKAVKVSKEEPLCKEVSNKKILRLIGERVDHFFNEVRFMSEIYKGDDPVESYYLNRFYNNKQDVDYCVNLKCLHLILFFVVFSEEENVPFTIEGCKYAGGIVHIVSDVQAERDTRFMFPILYIDVTPAKIAEFRTSSVPEILKRFIKKHPTIRFRKNFLISISCSVAKGIESKQILEGPGVSRYVSVLHCRDLLEYRIVVTLSMAIALKWGGNTHNYVLKQFMYDKSKGAGCNLILVRGVGRKDRMKYYEYEGGSISRVDPDKRLEEYEDYLMCAEYVDIEG